MKTSSQIFKTTSRKIVEDKIERLLNSGFDISKIEAPWVVGDYLGENFKTILGDLVGEYSSSFARRAMADLAFYDANDFYYVVDVKAHRLNTDFNMPNLTSVERLTRFYEDDKNYFVVLNVAYDIEGSAAKIKKVSFIPIEFLSWDCLTLGALGWGQIQIANSNHIVVNPKNSRKKWMLKLCDNLIEFYPKEIGKINERIKHFKKVRKFWENKAG